MVYPRVGKRVAVVGCRRRGVTILETFAIIALVALLASLMLPHVTKARVSSKRAVCLSQLKQITIASRTYEADDPYGLGIPVHSRLFTQNMSNPAYIGAYEWGGKSGIGRPGFVEGPSEGKLAWMTSKYGTKAGFGPVSRPMNHILYSAGFKDCLYPCFDRTGAERDTQLELGVFHCPADEGPPRGAHCPDWIQHGERSSYDHFGNSYAANLFMTAASPYGGMSSNSPFIRPTSRVPTPSRTLFYEENIGRWAWACRREIDDCTWIGPGVDPGPTMAVRGWHGKDWTFNRAFVDAHAETQRIYIEGTEDAEGYAQHYRNEHLNHYPGFTDNAAGFAYHRCIIVRGQGWQKDTLPAPQIPTGLPSPSSGRPAYEDCVE